MIHKRLHLYATKVLFYWRFEYDLNIAADPDALLDAPIVSQIVRDCYALKIQPCNCCGIIYQSLYSTSSLTIKRPDKPT